MNHTFVRSLSLVLLVSGAVAQGAAAPTATAEKNAAAVAASSSSTARKKGSSALRAAGAAITGARSSRLARDIDTLRRGVHDGFVFVKERLQEVSNNQSEYARSLRVLSGIVTEQDTNTKEALAELVRQVRKHKACEGHHLDARTTVKYKIIRRDNTKDKEEEASLNVVDTLLRASAFEARLVNAEAVTRRLENFQPAALAALTARVASLEHAAPAAAALQPAPSAPASPAAAAPAAAAPAGGAAS
jgi:hypothetical protein